MNSFRKYVDMLNEVENKIIPASDIGKDTKISSPSAQTVFEWVKTGHWNKRTFLAWLEDQKLEAYRQGDSDRSYNSPYDILPKDTGR